MIELRIANTEFNGMRETLLSSTAERCAVLLATSASRFRREELMLVRETIFPTADDYIESEVNSAVLRPEFVAKVAKRARLEELSLVFVHTHPGESVPRFSPVDNLGEAKLASFLTSRGQSSTHAAIVIGNDGLTARVLGSHEPIRVTSIGHERTTWSVPQSKEQPDVTVYDRQIRAFGDDGQKSIGSLNVAIVGLGGTGSILAQHLVHLGVRKFVLIDLDRLEPSNLNRVVNAFEKDNDSYKSDIAARYINQFAPDASVISINGDVVHESVARNLIEVDVIFSCTDSHGSRSVIQQIAYQYFISCFDMGTTISTREEQVTGIFGRVQLIGPDQPCLWCSGLLSPEEVRRDMMSESERRVDPYITGANIRAPSVISLNATVVSVAITMLLGLVTSVPVRTGTVIYNATSSSMRAVRAKATDGCFICSPTGVLGRGDSQALFARND